MNVRPALPPVLAAAFALACGPASAGAPLYHLDVLAAPGASTIQARDINDAGQIVGRYLDQDFNGIAAYWDADGVVHALALPGTGDGAAYAINGLGQIVGTFDDYENPEAGLLWDAADPGQWTRIGDASVNVTPDDINDAGVVVGGFGQPAASRAFVWTAADGLVDYGVEDESVEFEQARWSAVNAGGKLVGHYNVHSSDVHAIVGQAGTPAVQSMGPMSETYPSIATAVNAAGMAVGLGLAADSPVLVPVVFAADGSFSAIEGATLDQENGCAAAINDAGVIVGAAGIGTASGCVPGGKAWVYRDGAVYDLYAIVDDPGPFASFQTALAVNSAGVIVGTGRTADGGIASFVLTPVADEAIFADGFDG